MYIYIKNSSIEAFRVVPLGDASTVQTSSSLNLLLNYFSIVFFIHEFDVFSLHFFVCVLNEHLTQYLSYNHFPM